MGGVKFYLPRVLHVDGSSVEMHNIAGTEEAGAWISVRYRDLCEYARTL